MFAIVGTPPTHRAEEGHSPESTGMKSVEFTKPQEAISLFDGKPRMKDTLFNNFMAFEGKNLKNKPSNSAPGHAF